MLIVFSDLIDRLRIARKIERHTFHFAGRKNKLHPSTRIPPGWMMRVLAKTGVEEYVRLRDGKIVKSLGCAYREHLIELHSQGKLNLNLQGAYD